MTIHFPRRTSAKHPVRDLSIRAWVTLSLAIGALAAPVAAWADDPTPRPTIDVTKGTPDPTVRSAGDKVLGTFFYLIGLVGIYLFVKGVIKTGSDKSGGGRQIIVGVIVMLVGFVPGSVLTGVVTFGNGLFS